MMKFEQYKSYTGKGIRTVIIDSGLNCDHEIAKGKKFVGYSIYNGIVYDNGYNDKIGHGTAVYSLINKIVPDTDCIIFKLFDTDFCCAQIDLEIALEYIYNNIPCDIINISAGTCILESNRLYEICRKLNDKGVTILAAFDNVGAISFPAAFDCVIGVDSSAECKMIDEFEYIDNSLINIRAKGGMHRVAWINSEYAFVEGTSFSVAYATAATIKLVESGCRHVKEILSEFKNNAISIYNNHRSAEMNTSKSMFKINKAVVFPYSKEIDSLIRFYDQLNFEILCVCDYKLSGKIGMNISKQSQFQNLNYKDFIIRDVEKVNWREDFDTVILGYTDRIENLIKFDYKEYILKMCIKHKKNIYMFDNSPQYNALIKQIKAYGLQVFYPCVTNADIPQNRFGKMYRNAKPVVGVFGTSSHQGKFTLQLELIKSFSSNYKLASIGTEPTAPLFGMDYCFPMGYHSTVYINSYDSVFVLNDAIHRIADEDTDMVLVCSQYTNLPFDVANISMFTNNQYDFLMGTQPEAIVVTINPFDDFDYVKRTVKFLESAVDAKVVAIVVYPITIANDWTGFYGKKQSLNSDDYMRIKNYYESELNIPVFNLNEKVDSLRDVIIDYFS